MNYDDYGYSSGAGIAGIFFLIYGIVLGFALLVGLAYYIVMSIARSKFFRKVGVDGWIGWVPFYNQWKWLEIGGQPGWIALAPIVGLSIVSSIFQFIGMYRTGIAFRKDAGFLVLGIFLPFVWAFLLARPQEQYQPELITAAGYPPPLAGYGSFPRPAYGQQPPTNQPPTNQPPSQPPPPYNPPPYQP